MEEFSIHKPIHRNYTHELVFHKLMNEVGILSPKYGVINLLFNGQDRGVYAYEESLLKKSLRGIQEETDQYIVWMSSME